MKGDLRRDYKYKVTKLHKFIERLGTNPSKSESFRRQEEEEYVESRSRYQRDVGGDLQSNSPIIRGIERCS